MYKDIKGYEGYYKISDDGDVIGLERRVRNSNGALRTIKERKKSKTLDKDGYQCVKLSKEGRTKIYKVHRLVAEAYVAGYSPNKEVNHKNFIKTDNRASNLEWVSHKENIAYSKDAGKYKGRYGSKNSNYGNHKLRYTYSQNPELRKDKQGTVLKTGSPFQ